MIELRKVSKTYRSGSQEITALKDISLEIPGGAFCLLIGPSGCGKSTLLNLVGGLDFPTGGEILIGGVPVSRMTDREWTLYRREKIGVVFQFFNLLPSLSVNDNVSLPLALNGVSGKEAGHRVAELLEKVGLAGKGARLPRDLSGGEQQRAAIARAVVHSPSLVLADEPTGNLDSRFGAEILTLLKDLSIEKGITILMATHSREALGFGTRVVSLLDGMIVK
ncbi:MAG TPA: ABC transporter ATP-binding protein [Nitrospiria bacterium]|nr:ABC transporter ATP-binding protein [Nitrospiria bacterium]